MEEFPEANVMQLITGVFSLPTALSSQYLYSWAKNVQGGQSRRQFIPRFIRLYQYFPYQFFVQSFFFLAINDSIFLSYFTEILFRVSDRIKSDRLPSNEYKSRFFYACCRGFVLSLVPLASRILSTTLMADNNVRCFV